MVVSGFGGALQGRIQWGFIGLLAIALPHRTVLSCSPNPSAAWHPQWGAERRQCSMASRPTVPGSSEEHTSELQSLMRNTYAVFCLKKKNHERYEAHVHQTY